MPGSRSEIPLVLVYNNIQDKAYWMVISVFHRIAMTDSPYWEHIEETAENYQAIATMAGPRPVEYAEEFVLNTPTKDDNEPKSADGNNTLNPHDVAPRK